MTEQPRHGRRYAPESQSYTFWKEAVSYINANGPINCVFGRAFVMRHLNRSKKNLALKIRALEKKLNRPHRIIKQLGAVQYLGN